MAVYKVPQNVEADDKLIGPFSFRQFIYLIIVVMAGAMAWGLSRLFFPLIIIPLPIMIFFGLLALPLRKDQPMEIYMAAIVSFYLKPRKRLWKSDGIESLVEITAPKVVEQQRTKDLSQYEAEQRLSYLADIVDTGGWAVRGVREPVVGNSPMRTDAFFEAQQTVDVLDARGGVAQSFDTMITQADAKRRQDIMARLSTPQPTVEPPVLVPASNYSQVPTGNPYASPQPTPATVMPPAPTYSAPTPQPALTVPEPQLSYNPYPASIHQSVVQPLSDQPQAPPAQPPAPQPPSDEPISPDIINLANNADLSIETIAHEAQRIHEKEKLDSDEVVISLR